MSMYWTDKINNILHKTYNAISEKEWHFVESIFEIMINSVLRKYSNLRYEDIYGDLYVKIIGVIQKSNGNYTKHNLYNYYYTIVLRHIMQLSRYKSKHKRKESYVPEYFNSTLDLEDTNDTEDIGHDYILEKYKDLPEGLIDDVFQRIVNEGLTFDNRVQLHKWIMSEFDVTYSQIAYARKKAIQEINEEE